MAYKARILSPADGGTGVGNNAASTLTISGAFGATFTFTNTTSVTFPTSGTLATTSQLPSLPLSPASGGTGIANNAASTLAISGNFATTLTVTNTTGVTLPTSGTLATTSQIPALPLTVSNGGTGVGTLTSHGVLLGQGTGNVTATAAGSAGQVLQSGGASADPTYSTATYPSTATGTSKVLVADGTNWVASTPTFPNASATLNKVIKSDGTNWIASTETYAAPGTSGNVMTSDGTNWTSAAGSGILIAASQITSAQVKALHGTPIQVIAAPGNGKVIQLISAIGTMNYGGTNVFVAGASQTIQLTYGTIGSQTAGMVLLANSDIVAAASQIHQGNIILNTTTYASIQNTAVNLYNSSATEISGNAAGNNTVSYSVLYRIVTIP